MAKLRDLELLKEAVERKQREAAEAKGAEAQALRQLKQDHGCNSLEAAEVLLKKMTKDVEEAEQEIDTAYIKFVEEHGEELGLAND